MIIGIIGNGFVGGAVSNGLSYVRGDNSDIRIYDVNPEKQTHTFDETIQSDFVFVCLPTPMESAEGGNCNLVHIENFFSSVPESNSSTFIIKSTVPVGTTDRLCREYPHLKIVHNPEFLTAANANEDFINADRTVIGGKEEWVHPVKEMYEKMFSDIPVVTMSSSESECVKYFANCFLATKVMVFNEMKLLADEIEGVNYDNVMRGVISDRRIGKSHYEVPGPDGDYGFGGTCFPKDINALIHIMQDKGLVPLVLKSVWEQNKNYRNHWDWADNESAVLKGIKQ